MRVWLLALLVVVPTAGAQVAQPSGVATTLYMHVIDVQDMPINTQAPDPAYSGAGTWGMATMTFQCLREAASVSNNGLTQQAFGTMYGYGAPRDVDYGSRSANGDPRTRPERGVAADVHVDPATTPTLVWYMATGEPARYQDVAAGTAVPTPVPHVQVRATVRAGDAISIDDEAYNTGRLLMEGTSPTVTLVADQVVPGPDGMDGVSALGLRDGRWVYEFRIPLTVADPVIPKADGYNIRIDAYMDVEQCDPDDSVLLPASVGGVTAEGARPRLELALRETFVVEQATAAWRGDDLVVGLLANSVWGADDLDVAAARIEITGPGQAAFVKQASPQPYLHHHGHSDADDPASLSWVWEGANRTADTGHYEVVIRVPNRQHTAELVVTMGLDRAPAQDAPFASPALALVAVAALAALRRK